MKKIKIQYSCKKGELCYKLFLTEDDKRTLIKIIDNIRSDEKIEFTSEDSVS